MNAANIFTHYKQLENHFTNGFVSILGLSRFESPDFVTSFLRGELGLAPDPGIDMFRVLPGEDGTADGELSGRECCIWLETKITSGSLCEVQIRRHLEGNPRYSEKDDRRKGLKRRPEQLRRLVLLTPDDSTSRYVRQFLSIDSERILHLEWKRVDSFFERFVNESRPSTFSEVVRQLLKRIHHTVFSLDMAGVVQKISFGDKSEVYADRYLDEMKAGAWTRWDTPRECKQLDGKGRKLILYDTVLRAITVEVEIKSVARTDWEADYPWTNEFAEETLHILEVPIPLSEIQMVQGFKSFGSNRSAFRNITHEQYRQLMSRRSATASGRTSGCS